MENERITKAVILPGSYDPVTLGHLEVIKHAKEVYGDVYVVIFINPEKNYTFSPEERVQMLKLATNGLGITVDFSPERVVDYMRRHSIEKIVKGYRNEKDFEYEMRQAEYNKQHGGYETVLVPCGEDKKKISSTAARLAIEKNEPLENLLPPAVIEFIKNH